MKLSSPEPQSVDVAVVIVNYRSASWTARALESLRRERARCGGAITLSAMVVENDSGDEAELRGLIRAHAEFASLVVSPRNGGFGAGNNLGVATLEARGKRPRYLYFLNPDAEVFPGAVQELVRFMEAHPKAGLCGSRFESTLGETWPFAFRFPSILSELEGALRWGPASRLLRHHAITREMSESEAAPVEWISGASMLVRRDAFAQVGGFDEGYFLYFEEIDLCRRLRDRGLQCWYVPQSRVMHGFGQSTGVTAPDAGAIRRPPYWFASRRRYFEKHHGVVYCALADAMFVLGNSLGVLKDTLKQRPVVPQMSRDVLRASPLSDRSFLLALGKSLRNRATPCADRSTARARGYSVH